MAKLRPMVAPPMAATVLRSSSARNLGGGATLQSAPSYPRSQKQLPLTHVPWPEQPLGQPSGVLQLTPLQPGSQKQLPREQTPRCEHASGHGTTDAQSDPLKPGSHSHRPRNEPPARSTMHAPRPQQRLGQSSAPCCTLCGEGGRRVSHARPE